DALWAGGELRRRGAAVAAVLLRPERAHAAGLAALRRAGGRTVDAKDGATAARAVQQARLVIDGIVGISGKGALRDPAPALVAAAAAAGVPVLACDLPSGVDCDTGAVAGTAVTSAATVTFGARKPVHALAAGRCGPVHLVDIGLEPHLPAPHAWMLEAADVAARWPLPGPADDKYSVGVTGIAAGSATYPGAAVLATGAAVLATSGMVRFAGSAACRVTARWPEVVATGSVAEAGRVQAWTVGPGTGTDDTGRALLAAVLDAQVPVCADADAVTLLARHADLRAAVRGRPIVITPHAGEFARIAGDVGPDRVAAARRAAADLGVTVLLKGNATVVADPDGRALVHPSPTSWAATAGSGDVLSGIVGALLAAGLEPWWAAGCAAWVHARAAGTAAHGAPAPASAIEAAIPEVLRRMIGSGAVLLVVDQV
ncbi:MAG: bifunctional ADP-dependent NAD(P)H-hydrate dehydratase/NAD(P)H-hydrate epimerase, partial [Pseudonocardia sp.]|nr:bifunctional ADP-dependent NAD(P)H-hydrate dehydratase/NAD(P)H-hydrate epimerase [Pseudonocardia sp.]